MVIVEPEDGEDSDCRVTLLDRRRVYDGFFKLDLITHRFRQRSGALSEPLERIVFERGDAVAVLPYDAARGCIVLVRQFRLPAYLREGEGWLWEVIAGSVDGGRTPEAVALAEAYEEAGLSLPAVHPVTTCFSSCCALTERIHVYVAPYDDSCRTAPGGGLPHEGEDIQVHEVTWQEALAMLERGEIRDAKTIIALQYLALRPPW
jgi:nudix-type nucleoside diphosphatase (YffH/AdpP family)